MKKNYGCSLKWIKVKSGHQIEFSLVKKSHSKKFHPFFALFNTENRSKNYHNQSVLLGNVVLIIDIPDFNDNFFRSLFILNRFFDQLVDDVTIGVGRVLFAEVDHFVQILFLESFREILLSLLLVDWWEELHQTAV